MIRGPVLPQSRDALWSLVSGRLDAIERGLGLVFEGFDCADGQLGSVEGLARDGDGAPVLIVLARPDDPLLVPRVLDASSFLHRVGDALGDAIPEAGFRRGAPGRVLVVAADGSASACEPLLRHASARIFVCALEPFRIAGSERFAVRWLSDGRRAAAAETVAAAPAVAQAAVLPAASDRVAAPSSAHLQALWSSLKDLCLRIDQGIRIDDDAERRRISWNGQHLAEVRETGGALHGVLSDGSSCALAAPADVGAFSNRVLRSYSELAGIVIQKRPATAPSRDGESHPAAPRLAANGQARHPRASVEGLRAAAAAARLSPEEHSALGGLASSAGGDSEYAALAGDLARIVAATEAGRSVGSA